jgi:hypothetical protein
MGRWVEGGKLGSWEDEKLRSTSRSALHFFLGKKTLKKIINCQLSIVNEFPGISPWPREVKWVLIFSREEILFNVQCWESNSTARSMAISTYLLREIFFCRAIKAAFLCSSGFKMIKPVDRYLNFMYIS